MDYIRREDLREEMVVVPSNTYEQGWNDALRSVYRNTPSVWIPATERLPENDTEVLYCDEHEVIGTCHFWNGFNKYKHSDGENEMTDIVAWMYLPEPYKGVNKC